MPVYYAAVEGDPLSSGKGSRVFATRRSGTVEGPDGKSRAIVFIGDPAYCCACESEGTVSYGVSLSPGRRMEDFTAPGSGRNQAVGGDIVLCKCETPPRIIPINGQSWMIEDSGEGARVSAAPSRAATTAASVSAAVTAEATTAAPVTNSASAVPPVPASRAQIDPGECAYLDGSQSRIDAPARFYDQRHAVTLSPGKPATATFPGLGKNLPATEYDALIEGHNIPIYVSKQAPPDGTALFNEKHVAAALATLPNEHLAHLDKVTINPVTNPDDANWQQLYHDPTFYSAATANIHDGVTVYPWKKWTAIPQRYVDSTVTHETAHQISEALWQRDPSMEVTWQKAIASDSRAPSEYARQNPTEDFAETANMYRSSRGTPCEAEGRKRYPARYRYFDAIMK